MKAQAKNPQGRKRVFSTRCLVFETRTRRLTDTVQRRTLVQQPLCELGVGDRLFGDALDVVVVDAKLDLGRNFVYGSELRRGGNRGDCRNSINMINCCASARVFFV